MIEALKLCPCRGRELVLGSISAIEALASMCILTIFYHMHHWNYAATGDVVNFFITNIMIIT